MMRAKPVRAALSLLGIYIGVLALVVILSIREGIRRQIEDQFKTQGARILFVYPGFDPVAKKIGRLSVNDVSLLASLNGVLMVEPRSTVDVDARAPGASTRAKVTGIDDRFIPVYRVPIIRGRAFLKGEVDQRTAVCLLSVQAVEKLFAGGEPIGQSVEMKGTLFQVIGVVDWSQSVTMRSALPEIDVLLPGSWLKNMSQDFFGSLEVRVSPSMNGEQAVNMVKDALSRGDAGREKLYFVRSLEQVVERSREFTDKISLGLLAIAAVSLLVGGIGVANVMITSVTERTREVGVRKALGAKRIDILIQFLVESSVLCASGGILAVMTGYIGVYLITTFLKVPIPITVPVAPVMGCFALTVFIGLIAGLYPASRAGALNPAEALRYE